MLNREKRLEINAVLNKKAEIIDKIEYNKAELRKLKEMFMVEPNDRNCKLIKIAIRRGEGIISTQKTEVLSMSAPRIAEVTDTYEGQVRYQEMLFNKARIIL